MIRLTEHIAYLLTRHDCVIVPGWGAFIVSRVSARFDEASGCFLAPRREVTFNAAVNANDGLLANSVSRREGLTYVKAVDAIAVEVDALRHQLELDGEVVIPRVGRFVRSESAASPLFEPFEDCVANAALGALPAVRVRRQAEVPAIEPFSPAAQPRRGRRVRIPAFVRVAAAMAVLLIMGFALTDRPFTDPASKVDFASMSPSHVSARASSLVTDDVHTDGELLIAIPAAEAEPEAAVAHAERGDFYLIVASLTSHSQARRFIAWMGDPSLRILAADGRYRVYVAQASTFDDATAAKTSAISARYPDAWVYGR